MDLSPSPTLQRRVPLRGSCHCGATQYVLFLTLPHPHTGQLPPPSKGVQRVYRCNCTVCHKSGLMHLRPQSPTDDFLLLSPLDPFAGLGDYQCFDKVLHFFFCRSCGGRCFVFAGEGEVVDVDLRLDAVSPAGHREAAHGQTTAPATEHSRLTRVWRPKRDGGHPEMGNYVSVNAHSVDAAQPGFDMRQLTESKHVMYCDCLSPEADEAPMTFERPQYGGCY